MVLTLILAWFLQLFGFGDIFIQALNELFNINISLASYYFIFAIIGLHCDLSNNK